MVRLSGPGDSGSFPLGTYRYTRTESDLLKSGMTPGDAAANAGVWTWTFGKGTWHFELQPTIGTVPAGYAGNVCDGWFASNADLLSLTTSTVYHTGECAPKVWTIRWRARGRDVVMHDMAESNRATTDLDYLFSGTWTRIG